MPVKSVKSFRTAVGGFNRQDVIDYISLSSKEHRNEIEAYRAGTEKLRGERDSLDEALSRHVAEVLSLRERIDRLENDHFELKRLVGELSDENARISQGGMALQTEVTDLSSRFLNIESKEIDFEDVQVKAEEFEKQARQNAEELERQARIKAEELEKQARHSVEELERQARQNAEELKRQMRQNAEELERQTRQNAEELEKQTIQNAAAAATAEKTLLEAQEAVNGLIDKLDSIRADSEKAAYQIVLELDKMRSWYAQCGEAFQAAADSLNEIGAEDQPRIREFVPREFL